ncbi:MAG: hypothetical protein L6V93_02180 [Clostridiales bacterium]|nr:MAG: hypothetical protein L6V93_02180 [Clostridiales bacterium]
MQESQQGNIIINTFIRIEKDTAAKKLVQSKYIGLFLSFGIYQSKTSQPIAINAAVKVNCGRTRCFLHYE